MYNSRIPRSWSAAVFLFSGLLFLTLACAALAQTKYTFTYLPKGSFGEWQPVAINNGARVIGTYRWRDYSTHSFTYRNGVANDLGTIPGFDNNFVTAINNRGQIVGSYIKRGDYYPPNQTDQAYLRDTDGKVTFLGSLESGAPTVPLAINDWGVVVGYSGDSAFIYQNGRISKLGPFMGHPVYRANAINNRGQIVALYLDAAGYIRTVLFSCGQMQDVNALDAKTVSGTHINDHGTIVGGCYLLPGEMPASVHTHSHGFIWSNGKAQNTLGDFYATAINNSDQISGNVEDYLSGPFATVYGPGGQDLGPLLETNGIYAEGGFAAGINDFGQVAGYGYSYSLAAYVAFLLTPVQ